MKRRRILGMIFGTAMVSALAPRVSIAATNSGLIAPPQQPMRFSRSITRQLGRNTRIIVARDYDVQFRRFADGFIVEGEQVGVSVEAPPNLATFAELERARIESAMFPLALDPFGQITSEASGQERDIHVEEAFNIALNELARQPEGGEERDEVMQFVTALHRAGTLLTANMPIDLFAPEQGFRNDEQTIPLPTGDIGRLSSRFDAERDQATGLMRRAVREVRTEIEDDLRETVEQWQLGLN